MITIPKKRLTVGTNSIVTTEPVAPGGSPGAVRLADRTFSEVELIGALSNPETGALLAGIGDALDTLGSAVAAHNVATVPRRAAQGEILRTIKLVLADQPYGLRTIEVRRLVEVRLGRQLPSSTVKGMLAQNDIFERMKRGRYRLRRA